MKRCVLAPALGLLLLLAGCGTGAPAALPAEGDAPQLSISAVAPGEGDSDGPQVSVSPVTPEGETPALPPLEETDWPAVSIDAAAFHLEGGMDNPDFAYVFDHTDTVPLDQLIAFTLTADALSEGACEALRSRFLEAPNTVLAYLLLMGDQQADFGDHPPAAEYICRLIASSDAAWHDGSEEFARTMETCRENYPAGPAAALLDVMEAEHAESMARNH